MTWTTSPPREPGELRWMRTKNRAGECEYIANAPLYKGETEFGPRIPSAEALAAMEETERLLRELYRQTNRLHAMMLDQTVLFDTESHLAALDAARKEAE